MQQIDEIIIWAVCKDRRDYIRFGEFNWYERMGESYEPCYSNEAELEEEFQRLYASENKEN